MGKKFYILFFRTKDNKFFYLNNENKGTELVNPEMVDVDNVINDAKKFKKSEFNKISEFVYSNLNAKSQFCITNTNIYNKYTKYNIKFDAKFHLTIFDKNN